jgi:hypothetical protein
MTLSGYTDVLYGYNSVVQSGLTAQAEHVKAIVPPLGAIMQWLKTFASADSGTTTSTTANHLVESGQNFLTTITVGMIVRNTTDATYAYVTAVNSNTDLTISSDIMVSGEAYTIYKTPYLPDGWAECNGQSLSDASSPYNGVTLPDLNVTKSFLRGSASSGTTGGANTHVHKWTTSISTTGHDAGGSTGLLDIDTFESDGTTGQTVNGGADDGYTDVQSSLPVYYEVVMIMRVK